MAIQSFIMVFEFNDWTKCEFINFFKKLETCLVEYYYTYNHGIRIYNVNKEVKNGN